MSKENGFENPAFIESLFPRDVLPTGRFLSALPVDLHVEFSIMQSKAYLMAKFDLMATQETDEEYQHSQNQERQDPAQNTAQWNLWSDVADDVEIHTDRRRDKGNFDVDDKDDPIPNGVKS